MLEILTITGPIYLAIAAGYAAARLGVFAAADFRLLGRFVILFALPALLFRALSTKPFAEILRADYMAVYAAGSLMTLTTGYFWGKRLSKSGSSEAAILSMGMSCPNSGFVGFPVMQLIMPQIAPVVLALNMLVENLMTIPTLLVLAEKGSGVQGSTWSIVRQLFIRLAKTPMIIGLVAGVIVSFLPIGLPSVLTRTIDMFANASAALSLFVIGGSLFGQPLGQAGKRVGAIVFGKLLMHAGFIFLAMQALPLLGLPRLEGPFAAAVLLTGAMPIMGIYTILAQRFRLESVSALGQVATTVISFFTVSGLLWLLVQAGWL